jgi:hypothetical protein
MHTWSTDPLENIERKLEYNIQCEITTTYTLVRCIGKKKTSARRFAFCKHQHIQAVKSIDSNNISKRVCTLQAPLHTHCGKAKAVAASAIGSALC